MSFVDVVVAREAIYDHDLQVIGYELMFRHVEQPGDESVVAPSAADSGSEHASTPQTVEHETVGQASVDQGPVHAGQVSERRNFRHRPWAHLSASGASKPAPVSAAPDPEPGAAPATESPPSVDDVITATTLFSSLSIGISKLVGDKSVFCSVDRALILGDAPLTLPPRQTTLQIRADVDLDDEVLAGCRKLALDGYRFALEDFHRRELTDQVMESIAVAKIDIREIDQGRLVPLMSRCWDYHIKLVANRLETSDDLTRARELGFQFFQGHALSRPRIVSGRTLETTAVGRMQVAASLIGTEVDLDELERIVRTEPGLIFQLLKLASVGTRDGTRREVRTLRDALVMVGTRRLQSWMALLLLAQPGVTVKEDMIVALTRARMAELLITKVSPWLAGLGFTAGMVSAFDLMLCMTAADVVRTLPLADDLREGAFGDTSAVGKLIRDVIDHQNGELAPPARSGLDEREFDIASLKAIAWAVEATQELKVA